MRVEIVTGIIGVAMAVIALVASVTYYHVKKDEMVKSAVESAIVKGIDPMSVRCAFGDGGTVCLVYAASLGKDLKK